MAAGRKRVFRPAVHRNFVKFFTRKWRPLGEGEASGVRIGDMIMVHGLIPVRSPYVTA
ncbi:hypothetical protein SAMN05421806_1178 [Streptomyces indicus]|uniref:Uncharacterized protein n=1 Tax=Streptomyces indicus TaxID=417292 RepID=A0A1G9GTL8_9ACTN|nr:hypothetical protein SAMN05421806_1178 [Streptomyces indicus]